MTRLMSKVPALILAFNQGAFHSATKVTRDGDPNRLGVNLVGRYTTLDSLTPLAGKRVWNIGATHVEPYLQWREAPHEVPMSILEDQDHLEALADHHLVEYLYIANGDANGDVTWSVVDEWRGSTDSMSYAYITGAAWWSESGKAGQRLSRATQQLCRDDACGETYAKRVDEYKAAVKFFRKAHPNWRDLMKEAKSLGGPLRRQVETSTVSTTGGLRLVDSILNESTPRETRREQLLELAVLANLAGDDALCAALESYAGALIWSLATSSPKF